MVEVGRQQPYGEDEPTLGRHAAQADRPGLVLANAAPGFVQGGQIMGRDDALAFRRLAEEDG